MEIKYMKKYLDTPVLGGVIRKGLPLEVIQRLEKKLLNGYAFPMAVRELLFLGGEICGLSIVTTDWETLYEDLEETLENNSFKLDRPIFPFDMRDGSVFKFFYLDEGEEDPKCYILTPPGAPGFDHGIELIRPTKNYTFSELVNVDLEHIKNGWAM